MQLFTPDECARIEGRLKELREHWTPRSRTPSSFYTLGAASYLDERAEYQERARKMNPLLSEHFGWVHERLLEFLTRRMRRTAVMAEGMGLPGFHIWETPSIFIKPEASIHFDLQYERTWPAERSADADTTRPLSFTLSIRLPQRGGGLNFWDVTYEQFRQFRESTGARLTPKDATILLHRLRHPYSVGAVAMHSGLLLHQIGEVDRVLPGDERITLQGHALLCRDEWHVYW